MGISLRAENISLRDRRTLMEIYERLDPIFSIEMDEAAKYIVDFFELEASRIHDFENAVRATKEFFPITGDC